MSVGQVLANCFKGVCCGFLLRIRSGIHNLIKNNTNKLKVQMKDYSLSDLIKEILNYELIDSIDKLIETSCKDIMRRIQILIITGNMKVDHIELQQVMVYK